MTGDVPDYVSRIPDAVPAGRVLVHNKVVIGITARRRPGYRGFRAWLDVPSDRIEACPCPWAPELATHYRSPATGDRAVGASEWRLVTGESARSEHNAVRRMDDWLSREDSRISPFHWRPETASNHPDWEAWIWGHQPRGGAIFTQEGIGGAAWHLDRVWIRPDMRRRGALSAVWPLWEMRYGVISTSPSEALQAFLTHRGWAPAQSGSPIWLPRTEP